MRVNLTRRVIYEYERDEGIKLQREKIEKMQDYAPWQNFVSILFGESLANAET